jgi:hypothetical protein
MTRTYATTGETNDRIERFYLSLLTLRFPDYHKSTNHHQNHLSVSNLVAASKSYILALIGTILNVAQNSLES